MHVKEKGFTLIEVLLVISITCILAAVALPRVNTTFDVIDVENAAKELVCDLRWIQQLSLNCGGTGFPRLVVSPSPPGYYIVVNSNTIKKVTFPRRVKISGSVPSTFTFGLAGFPSSPFSLSLQSGTESRSVIIDSVGRVRISK